MKQLFCIISLLILCPFMVFAQDDIPSEAQIILEEPGITAEEFQHFSLNDLLSPLIKSAKEQLQKPLRLFCYLLSGILLSSAVMTFLPGEDSIETICVLGILGLVLSPVLELVSSIITQINDWQTYLISFIPVFSGVMITCGQITQATVYSGMFLTMTAFVSQAIRTIAMPIVQVLITLTAASGICTVQGLSDGCKLLNKTVKWIMGILSILFTSVLGLQSALAYNTDNLATKTGRFILKSGIPIVGSIASEAMESVLCGLKILKGSLGFAAIAVITISFIPILIQSIGFYIAFSLGHATAKAFSLNRISKTLDGIGQSIELCISFLVVYFMLIVLCTALMILTGGG